MLWFQSIRAASLCSSAVPRLLAFRGIWVLPMCVVYGYDLVYPYWHDESEYFPICANYLLNDFSWCFSPHKFLFKLIFCMLKYIWSLPKKKYIWSHVLSIRFFFVGTFYAILEVRLILVSVLVWAQHKKASPQISATIFFSNYENKNIGHTTQLEIGNICIHKKLYKIIFLESSIFLFSI